MLKIKDNVDLKELEKFGFHKEKDCITNKYDSYSKYSTRVWFYNRKLAVRDAHFGEYDFDIIYDLVKADLVEKVGEIYE